jgi:signal peptidase
LTAPARPILGTAWTILALLGAATGWVAVGFLVALLVLVSGGQVERYQFMSVLSGSMVPAVEVGDLVVAKVVTPDQLRAGELATFREPETGKLVTHRVQSIVWHGELADVVTRGDANEVGENWSLGADDHVGEVVLRVPHAGYAVGMLATPAGQLGLAGLAAVLGVWILVVLWRPQRSDEAEESEPATPGSVFSPGVAAAAAH